MIAEVRRHRSRPIRWVRRLLIMLYLVGGGVFAASPPWPPSPYSYYADGAPLEKVLSEFASGFSLELALQPGVEGSVIGRFTTANPTEFLNRLGTVYGFAWYVHRGVLYVSKAKDVVMRSIPVPSGGIGNLRATLTELGIIEPRFGWGELTDHGILIVSGPVTYVDLIEETLRQLPSGGPSGRQIRVFRLRHAAAEDRTVTYRDQKITQPGLATVLRTMLGAGGAPSVMSEKLSDVPVPLPAAPALGSSASPGGPALQAAPKPRGAERSGRQGPSIQSDPRLNALIVSDYPEMMPAYERLIAELDIPSRMIEIEAMIIDINTDRAREIGIHWNLRSGGLSASFNIGSIEIGNSRAGGGASGSANGGSGGGGDGGASGPAADLGGQLLASIRLLEKVGDARVQSRPSLLTTDNIGALIDLSETFYVRVQGERAASVSPVTYGTTLKVTPRLVAGDPPSIQLTVDIEDGQIVDRQIDSLPTVRRSTVSTQAVVRQGEALVIAGYSSDQNSEAEQKVPMLGDIPILGALFSNKVRSAQKRERFFLIKPKLVTALAERAAGAAP